MLFLIFTKNISYQTFLKNKEKLKFKYLFSKIRSTLPPLLEFNKKVILNDGLPVEFIETGYKSSKIINNRDILIEDWTSKLNEESNFYQTLNNFISLYQEDGAQDTHFIILSLSGDFSGGGVKSQDVDLVTLFVGSWFEKKQIVDDFYTINDLAITINKFYDQEVINKRGREIKFINRK